MANISHMAGPSSAAVPESVDTSYKTSKPKERLSPFCYVCIIAVIILIIAFAPQLQDVKDDLFYHQNRGYTNSLANETKFHTNISFLEETFKNQNEYFWNSLKKLGSKHIQDVKGNSVQRPLVLTLVTTKSNKLPMECMARKIGSTFTVGKPHVFNGREFTQSPDLKSKLDNTINDALLTDEKVVVFHELNVLSYQLASLFFKYCDSEETPFPDAIFILTLVLDKDKSFLNNDRKVVEKEVERYLKEEAWKDEKEDKTAALLMRVAEVPIVVFEEDHNFIKIHCVS